METIVHEGWALESRVPSLVENLEKLSARAKKLGCPAITWEVTDETKRSEERDDITGLVVRVSYYRLVKVSGAAPVYNGWHLVAVIDHIKEDGTNLFRVVPGEELPEHYRKTPQHCDHCGHSRYRKTTIVVRHEDGTYKQLGSACVKDFLGHPKPESFLWQAEWPSIFEGMFNEGGGHREWEGYDLKTFMTVTAAVVREFGWLSRGKANESGGYATADIVNGNVADLIGGRKMDVTLLPEDEVMADKTINFINSMPQDNLSDYEYNLKASFELNMVIPRYEGIVASGLNYFMRKNDLLEKKEWKNSVYVGTVGDKITVKVKVLNIYWFETQFGSCGVHKFLDNNGNIFIWKTGHHGLVPDDEIVLKGTIKEHNEYKEKKQTVLTRCKVLEKE